VFRVFVYLVVADALFYVYKVDVVLCEQRKKEEKKQRKEYRNIHKHYKHKKITTERHVKHKKLTKTHQSILALSMGFKVQLPPKLQCCLSRHPETCCWTQKGLLCLPTWIILYVF